VQLLPWACKNQHLSSLLVGSAKFVQCVAWQKMLRFLLFYLSVAAGQVGQAAVRADAAQLAVFGCLVVDCLCLGQNGL
jgi:hypothetical protein